MTVALVEKPVRSTGPRKQCGSVVMDGLVSGFLMGKCVLIYYHCPLSRGRSHPTYGLDPDANRTHHPYRSSSDLQLLSAKQSTKKSTSSVVLSISSLSDEFEFWIEKAFVM